MSVNKKYHPLLKFDGGKMLRPTLVLLSARALGGNKRNTLYSGAAVEILHNYTLIIDDIMDKGEIRRGKPTVWKEFGSTTAECIAMFYGSSIFQAGTRSPHPVLISQLLAKTLKRLVEGQIEDMLLERGGREGESYAENSRIKEIKESLCLSMIEKKTTSLLEACCEIGALCAKASPAKIKALKEYGYYLGLAFQIKDDLLDIFGDEKKFGKDVIERKGGNFVLALAYKQANNKEKKEIDKIMSKKRILKKDIKRVVEIVESTGSKEKTEKMADNYVLKAQKSLEKVPQNKWSRAMADLAEFVVNREK